MENFSATELTNKTGDILAAAARVPVTISRHGKPHLVVLSSKQYQFLLRHGDTRKAIAVDDLSVDEADSLVRALQDSIDGD